MTLSIPVVSHPAGIDFRDDDVVLLAMKSQHTGKALSALAATAPDEHRGGGGAERRRQRAGRAATLRGVYGVCVVCPALHLEPGVVEAHAAPITGILDVGRFPHGVDERSDADRGRVRRVDLRVGGAARHHAVEVRQAPEQPRQRGRCAVRSRPRGAAVATAGAGGGRRRASPPRASTRSPPRRTPPGAATTSSGAGAPARSRPGSSSWQSLARGTGSIEADYLNGEIVLLGRIHGVPTPVNLLLQQTAARAAREGLRPGSLRVDELIQMVAVDE